MKNQRESTDFINFGTYKFGEADILKSELEKRGIPVKILYPGTDIGKEATAGAYFTAYKLLIRACDFPAAEELRKKFSIEPIKAGEEMPLPKPYAWAKRGLSRYFFVGLIISYIGIIISSYLSSSVRILPENIPFYFITAFFIFFLLWLCTTVYNIIKKK